MNPNHLLKSLYKKVPLLLVVFFCIPFFAQAENIQSFNSDIRISKDSSLQVVETIDYYFDSSKHGIFRVLKTQHPDKTSHFYEKRVVEIEVGSVLMDGVSVPFTVDESSGEVNIKIGDPDKTITDLHTYQIEYQVLGALSYLDSGEVELYWNITGNDWPTAIAKATTNISSDEGVLLSKNFCYFGGVGQSKACVSSFNLSQSAVFSVENLRTGEGMTIAQSINPSMVKKVELTAYNWLIILLPLVMLFASIGPFILYRYKVKYRFKGPVIAQYEPYPGIKPMYSGLVFDGRLDSRDITACIIYLAERGYLKIKKTTTKVFMFDVDDFELTLANIPDYTVGEFEKMVLELIFGTGMTYGQTVALSRLKDDYQKRKENSGILVELRSKLRRDLINSGFNDVSLLETMNTHFGGDSTKKTVLTIVTLVSLVIAAGVLFEGFVLVFLVPAIFCLMFVFAVTETRRTKKGYEVLNYLKGFKLFLEVTDKERFDFHNAPEKSPEQFMEYLPYAVAFGVEKKWAKVFEDIDIGNPDWYESNNSSSFTPTVLTSSLGDFSTALASSSTPSSSGASGGGGFSGGGGGGGGGGSW